MLPRVFGLYIAKNSALFQTEYKNVLMNLIFRKGKVTFNNYCPE